MSIEFRYDGTAILMLYAPIFGHEEIRQKLDSDGLSIKNVFSVKADNEYQFDLSDEFEETFCFKVGELVGDYYRLDKNILDTDHWFYISKDVVISAKHFVAYQNISIFRKIDDLVDCDVYITNGADEAVGYIPFAVFERLINTFPNSTETKKYTHARIAQTLSHYFEGLERVSVDYEKYLNKRTSNNKAKPFPELQIISLELFIKAHELLKEMLNHPETYSERDWQAAICNIVCVIYPKYILAKREIEIGSDGRHNKRPDFLLVDSSGFVDILEIKKPNQQRLLTRKQYRDNYVADRDLSGAILQIEKYVYTLSHGGTGIEKKLEQHLANELPECIQIRVANPQGMLLMGRSNDLSEDEKFDLEFIKRQHKNIVDIMTYDDLLERMKNIITHLRTEEERSYTTPHKTI